MFKPLCPIESQIESALKLYSTGVVESSNSSEPNRTQDKVRETTPPLRKIKDVSIGELTSQKMSYNAAAVKTADRIMMTTKTREASSQRECASGMLSKEDKIGGTENGVVRKIQNIVQN